MIHALFALLLVQDPTPPQQQPPPPDPAVAPAKQEKPPRSREDRLEGRVAVEPSANAAPEAPAPAAEAAKPAEDQHPGWIKLNACALIVNEEPVTVFDIQRDVTRTIRERKGGDPDSILPEVVNNRAEHLLEVQGGKDLGFDPAQIDRLVRNWMALQTELAGSVTQLAADLKSEEINSFERKDELSDMVNKRLWVESVTGVSPSPGGRISRDLYVRPGFAMLLQRMAARAAAPDRTVQVTQMVFVPQGAPGGMERAKKQLEELRVRIENGEDMGALSEEFHACKAGTRGLSQFLSLDAMRVENPDSFAFLDKAQVGELSPVLEFQIDGKLAGYALVRPEEFKTPKVEPFDEPQAQRKWIEDHRQRLKDWRKQAGLMQLLSAAYVWPPQTFKPPKAQKP